MPDLTLRIDGMHCGGCEDRVQNALSRAEGIRSVDADHEQVTATVTLVAGQEDEQALREAVEDLGYEVTGIDQP